MKTKKIWILIISLILISLLCMAAYGQESAVGKYQVKSTAYWTYPRLTLQEAEDLAPYGLIIIDLENFWNNPESLIKIKEINPSAKLVCYSNPMEFFDPVLSDRPQQQRWSQRIATHYASWLLKTAEGSAAIFWPGMIMLNLSAACPTYETPEFGEINYGQWMAQEILRLLENPIWDGYYMDNGGGNISWLYQDKGTQIDADGDGQADENSRLDSTWSLGVHDFLKMIRQAKGPDFILLANKGSVEFMDVLDGRFFENFPCDYLGDKQDGGWHQCMYNALQTGPYTTLQVPSSDDAEFGVASALLVDAYVAIGQDNLRNYPQLRHRLGQALGVAMRQDSLFFREFENGRVEVRPATKQGRIILR